MTRFLARTKGPTRADKRKRAKLRRRRICTAKGCASTRHQTLRSVGKEGQPERGTIMGYRCHRCRTEDRWA